MAERPKGHNSRATLTDVAAMVGVSATTASFVLAGKAIRHRISEDTVERIRSAARDLDYSPNLLVRSMQRGRTGILSFFNGFRNREPDDLYMDRLSTALELAAGRRGYNVLVQCDYTRTNAETYQFLNGGHADGVLLFAPRPEEPLLPPLRDSRLPCVLIGIEDPADVLPSVRDDVGSGMEQMADRLVALGHRRVAAIGQPADLFLDSGERIRQLRALLDDRGAELAEENVFEWSEDLGGLLRGILSRKPEVTAVFCWRDYLAYRLLETCDDQGVDVPGRLSVAGYDGLRWPAATRHTAASVHVDLVELATSAVQLLIERIGSKEGGVSRIRVPVSFHDGTSLG